MPDRIYLVEMDYGTINLNMLYINCKNYLYVYSFCIIFYKNIFRTFNIMYNKCKGLSFTFINIIYQIKLIFRIIKKLIN